MLNCIRMDPPEEILANKLCTLLERAEVRDLWMYARLKRQVTGWKMRSPQQR